VIVAHHMTRQSFYTGGLILLAWVLFSLSAALWIDLSVLVKVLAIGLFGLTLYRPMWGIGVFLVMMPFYGGSKPGDTHTIHFLELFTVLDLALCIGLLQRVYQGKQSLTLRFSHPMVFVAVIYWLVALMSLSTVAPDAQLLDLFWPDPHGAYSFFALTEDQKMYSWLAWFTLTESLLLGFVIYNLNTVTSSWGRHWSFCVLFGLLISLVLGVLDFYDLINLSKISPNFYGVGERHTRLMSVFGNSGWFAQFVTLATPTVLAILTLAVSKRSKLIMVIALMSLTEFTLILSYQRGGWISYPLTLLVVWFCVYVLDDEEQSATEVIAKAKGAVKNILVSIPITIALSLSLVYGINKLAPAAVVGIDSYVARAASIKQTEARTVYWEPTTLMLKPHPVLGAGNESFAYQFGHMYLAKDAPYALTEEQKAIDIMQGSAHNMYFQALAGKGVLGLLSLLALMWVSVMTCWSLALTEPTAGGATRLSSWQRLVLMMGLSYTAALSIYGNVGEIFYVPVNYILFVFFYALVVREVPIAKGVSKQRQLFIFVVILVAFIAHLIWEYGYPGASREALRSGNPNGCYVVEGETWLPVARYRWCSRRFTVRAPMAIFNAKPHALISLAPHIPARNTPFIIKVYYLDRLVLTRAIDRGKVNQILVPLPENLLPVASVSSQFNFVTLDIKTNDSFIPSLLPTAPSTDNRNLSVQWFFNALPHGCYDIEGSTVEPSRQYRWCANQFSIQLPLHSEAGQHQMSLALLAPLLAGHDTPFIVKVFWAGQPLQEHLLERGRLSTLLIDVPTNAVSVGGGSSVTLDFVTNDAFVSPPDPRLLSVQWYFNQ